MAPITVSEVRGRHAGGAWLDFLRTREGLKFMKSVAVEGAQGLAPLPGDAPEPTYPDVQEFDEFDLGDAYMFLEVARGRGTSRGLIVRPSRRVPGAYERVGVHETSISALVDDDGTARHQTRTVIVV
jgi:hypothetical protein